MENLIGRIRRVGGAGRRTGGLLVPQAFLERTTDEVRRALRYDRPFSVALVLIDGLGEIRIAAGNAAAEAVNSEIAARLMHSTRGVDGAGRLGPALFGVLMPETRITSATAALERLGAETAAAPAETAAGRIALSLSIGVAAVTPRLRDAETLLMAACLELRRARSHGGNRVSALPVERLHITLPRSAGLH